ncbi:tripartite tricarboxylate transporter substrate binding protein [Achromobacter xylosoxidans]|jgi:tripartite-type tricarboxylate transporter receptor subunit TctC|uniref:Bug family tripartite tricarboxylate transporter substrate binding protein n=1 Tax=Alcaligenes xylosoxydans xylosoxydans TaxID=85698 RepID=UPI0006C08DB7|nr:tripartite tricarboxylate transporter substrate binding protein [Achromobacter xylosoxidans]KAA5920432.1 tripartite tricarboxylate transporter substrate binding protein [Achromobacter xylosoxidans]MBK1981785.1 tripartite tricarboxylate transporter substrate binding protein [Achromobacter xylosoxidans]MCZ8388254.1 tripartite tricarboxylate transporter substrate binding protein [Achromobacter xylosoxidans]QQE60132.1 tripartite tricarboxylate transporter substrate binding protein [Achromobacter
MKTLKRLLCGVAVASALCAPAVAADSYPSQPITLVNPYAAGGPADVLGRALARELEKQLGKTIIVENKAGGGAAIGANFVARAKPDGYTLLLGTSAAHVVTPLMQQTPYDGIKDFAFVSIVANQPNMLVVRPTLKADSVEQLIAMARKEPGRINYASAGPGSSPHLGAELFRERAGVDIVHIPYSGAAPAINDLVGGQVDMAVLNLAASLQFIRSGRLKALAYANGQRSPLLPDVPTLAESGVKGAESASWYSLAAPKGTPPEILQRLNDAVAKVNADPEYSKLMQAQGVDLWNMTPQEATAFVEKDQAAMRKLVQAAGLMKK